MKARYLPVFAIMLPPLIGQAGDKPQFTLEVVKAIQTERESSYYVPGTPSQSRTTCNGSSTDLGTTGTLSTNCTTTTSPGSASRTGEVLRYSEDMRVVMPDGSQLVLWCQEGLRTCLHLAAGRYQAERDKDTVWIYCTYADQENWNETGMSPGQRKANHVLVRVKYRVVGDWNKEEIRQIQADSPSQAKPSRADPALIAWSNLANDTTAASGVFSYKRRDLQPSEVKCGEPFFGLALVCNASDLTVVVDTVATRPANEIYRYWLEKISDDFVESRRTAAIGCKDSCGEVNEFLKNEEIAYRKSDSVWSRLRTAYCNDVGVGNFPDLDGRSSACSEDSR
jgi:hypothetical protein